MTLNIDFKNKNRIITPRLLLRPIVKNDTELIVEWRNHLAKEQILIQMMPWKHTG